MNFSILLENHTVVFAMFLHSVTWRQAVNMCHLLTPNAAAWSKSTKQNRDVFPLLWYPLRKWSVDRDLDPTNGIQSPQKKHSSPQGWRASLAAYHLHAVMGNALQYNSNMSRCTARRKNNRIFKNVSLISCAAGIPLSLRPCWNTSTSDPLPRQGTTQG